MKRVFTVCFIAGLLAGLLFSTAPAEAAPTCTVTQQFASTQIGHDIPPIDWTLLIAPTMTASCSSKWYVSFTPQCKTGHTSYQACGVNVLCGFADSCTPNQVGWGAGTTHTYDEPSGTPQGFTGYWNAADGFNQPGDVCDYVWRVKETFKNGYDNTLITTKFTPETTCT